MNVTLWMQRHRRSLLFLALMLAIGGIASSFLMPVALFPNVAFPRVQVTLDAGDRPADQMAVAVTTPVEVAVRRVRGVRSVRSTTSRGSADIAVTFDWGADMAAALQAINAAAGQVLPELPAGTRVTTRRMDPTTFPMLAYSLRSHTLSPAELHDLAQYQLRPLLTGITGVAQVKVQGGEVAEFHVDVDPDKLRALDLSLADVTAAVGHAATIQAMGRVSDHYKLYLLLANNQPTSLAALRDIVVRAGPGGVVRVGDLATVRTGHVPQWIKVNADGQNAVLLQVYQQPSGNSVQIARDVKKRLADVAPQMPAGVSMASWYDQTRLVTSAAGSVRDAILIGIALAGLVLFVFLRNTRVILIALIVVPAVLAITVLLLSVLGMSFNMMTLGGMAAAVGLIIDDVIVMLEHIMRRLREGSGPVSERIAGARRRAAVSHGHRRGAGYRSRGRGSRAAAGAVRFPRCPAHAGQHRPRRRRSRGAHRTGVESVAGVRHALRRVPPVSRRVLPRRAFRRRFRGRRAARDQRRRPESGARHAHRCAGRGDGRPVRDPAALHRRPGARRAAHAVGATARGANRVRIGSLNLAGSSHASRRATSVSAAQ